MLSISRSLSLMDTFINTVYYRGYFSEYGFPWDDSILHTVEKKNQMDSFHREIVDIHNSILNRYTFQKKRVFKM